MLIGEVHGPEAGTSANVQDAFWRFFAVQVVEGREEETAVHGQVADVVADVELIGLLFVVRTPAVEMLSTRAILL